VLLVEGATSTTCWAGKRSEIAAEWLVLGTHSRGFSIPFTRMFHTPVDVLINTAALARCSEALRVISRFDGFPWRLTNCWNSSQIERAS